MEQRKKIAMVATYCLLVKKKKKRKIWTKEFLGDYQRLKNSFTFNLEPIIFKTDKEEVKSYVRMDSNTYNMILELISPLITKKDTNIRLAITPKEKLSLTLSFLAEGLSLKRLSYEYRVGVSTASEIIDDTIDALNEVLVPKYLTMPNHAEEWNLIIQRFNKEWNFPNCIGALDGKHIHMYPPRNSGSLFFNYKEGFSIVLLALVDADYKFIGIDAGANGKCSDSGVWSSSLIRKIIANNQVNLPAPTKLPQTETLSPYVIVADSGFPLEDFVMRPYPEKGQTPRERIFNYRLSRARRVSENAFGILSNRWRILLQRQLASPRKVTAIVTACCALHNLLCSIRDSRNLYIPDDLLDKENILTGEVIPGLWRKHQLDSLEARKTSKHSYEAKIVREKYKNYFSEEGKVSWQNRSVGMI